MKTDEDLVSEIISYFYSHRRSSRNFSGLRLLIESNHLTASGGAPGV